MPDHSESQTGDATVEGPGAQLRRAREGKGLLLRDVAQELHLDEWMLQALEEDDFSALGAPVFAKGHMRKYGSMLGLDTDDLMIAYYRKRGRDDSPPPITHMQSPRQPERRFALPDLRWLIAVLAIVLLVLLAWTFLSGDPPVSGDRPASTLQAVPPATTPEEIDIPETEPVMDTVPADADSTEPEMATGDEAGSAASPDVDAGSMESTENEASDSAATIEPVEEPPPPAGRRLEIRLEFDGESWAEVTDSEGNRLLYNMMDAGRVRTVTGTPPIEVFLGRSRVVRLEVDGEPYPVPRRAIRGNTARFVIDPDAN